MKTSIELVRRTATTRLFVLLLLADVSLIVLHASHKLWDVPIDTRFSIDLDRSFGEILQYAKELATAAILMAAATRRRSRLLLTWSVVFGYLLADDALELHEQLGAWLSATANDATGWGAEAASLGEVAVSLVIGVGLLGPVLVSHARGGEDRDRIHSLSLLVLLAALAFFGVIVDVVHDAVAGRWPRAILAMVEDGGEMVVMSLIVPLAVAILGRTPGGHGRDATPESRLLPRSTSSDGGG